MKKFVALAAVVAVTALTLTAVSIASTSSMGVSARLTAGAAVPKQVVKEPMALGQFVGTLRGNKLSWKLTFSHLTGKATAAHIHFGRVGKAGAAAAALCGPCMSGARGTATLNARQLKNLSNHLFYVNIHTAKNPDGEIRGQLSEN